MNSRVQFALVDAVPSLRGNFVINCPRSPQCQWERLVGTTRDLPTGFVPTAFRALGLLRHRQYTMNQAPTHKRARSFTKVSQRRDIGQPCRNHSTQPGISSQLFCEYVRARGFGVALMNGESVPLRVGLFIAIRPVGSRMRGLANIVTAPAWNSHPTLGISSCGLFSRGCRDSFATEANFELRKVPPHYIRL
jgi:hypothetical protein